MLRLDDPEYPMRKRTDLEQTAKALGFEAVSHNPGDYPHWHLNQPVGTAGGVSEVVHNSKPVVVAYLTGCIDAKRGICNLTPHGSKNDRAAYRLGFNDWKKSPRSAFSGV